MIDRLLVLCTVSADGLSRNGFRWPLATGAVAQCPDWDPNPHRYCGGGLHGLPWGIGDGGLLTWDHDNRWLIVDVDLAGGIIGSADKCRFRRCTIMHVGDRYSATEYLIAQGGDRSKILGAIATAGDNGTATAGHGGTATAGRGGTLAIRWWDNHRARNRIVSADVGDNGIKPNVPYIVRNGKLVRKDEP
jgi:hypothetical protein